MPNNHQRFTGANLNGPGQNGQGTWPLLMGSQATGIHERFVKVKGRPPKPHQVGQAKWLMGGSVFFGKPTQCADLDEYEAWLRRAEPGPVPPLPGMAGNFLGAQGFELRPGNPIAFQYAGLTADQRKRLVTVYRANGWNALPMSVWDDWGEQHGHGPAQTYDYTDRVAEFRDKFVLPLRDAGIRTILMGLTERVGHPQKRLSLSEAKRLLDKVMPPLRTAVDFWCAGWEIQQDVLPDFDDNLAVLDHMRTMMAPDSILTWHGGSHRWGAVGDGDDQKEANFWNAANCDGLLYQLPSDSSVNHIEDNLFEFKPMADGTKGIVGRVVDQHKKLFYCFETKRTTSGHADVVGMLERRNDDRVSGFN